MRTEPERAWHPFYADGQDRVYKPARPGCCRPTDKPSATKLVENVGIEPTCVLLAKEATTPSSPIPQKANIPNTEIGALGRVRSGDIHVGDVVLCQLSYERKRGQ